MTSREIADLTEKRHDNVKRLIDSLAAKGLIESPQSEVFRTATNKGTEYHVGQRDSYVIVAQLSPEFTARLVDRWQESKIKATERSLRYHLHVIGAVALAHSFHGATL